VFFLGGPIFLENLFLILHPPKKKTVGFFVFWGLGFGGGGGDRGSFVMI